MSAPESQVGSASDYKREKKDASFSRVTFPEFPSTALDTTNKEHEPNEPVRIVGFEKVKPYNGLEMATVVLSTDQRMGRFKIGGHNYTILGLFIDDGTGEAPVTPTIQKIEEEIERVNKKKVVGATSIGGLNQQIHRLGYEIVNIQPYGETVQYLFRKKVKKGEVISVKKESTQIEKPTKKSTLPKKYAGPSYEWYEPSPVYYVRQRPEELFIFDASDEKIKRRRRNKSPIKDIITKISGVPLVSPEEIATREAKYRAQVDSRVVQVIDDHEFPPTPPVASAEVHLNQRNKELLARIPLASIVTMYLRGELTTYEELRTNVKEQADAHPRLEGKNVSPTIPSASDLSIGISGYVIRLLRESQGPKPDFLPGEKEAVAMLTALQKTGPRFAETLSTEIQMRMLQLQRKVTVK